MLAGGDIFNAAAVAVVVDVAVVEEATEGTVVVDDWVSRLVDSGAIVVFVALGVVEVVVVVDTRDNECDTGSLLDAIDGNGDSIVT